MAHYKAVIAYDGTSFHGFQRQKNVRTVQQDIETALTKIGWQGSFILGSGRTDAGVHASGQVISFHQEWKHTTYDLFRAINSVLPDDIAAKDVVEVAKDFHPRFDATSRRYRYLVLLDPAPDPLRKRYTWRIWPALTIETLQGLADQFIGTQDFAGYGTPPIEGGTTTRTVLEAKWSRHDNLLSFEIEANAFLYRMVRRIVQVQIDVARGYKPAEYLTQHLKKNTTSMVQGVAPPHGLTLIDVRYAK